MSQCQYSLLSSRDKRGHKHRQPWRCSVPLSLRSPSGIFVTLYSKSVCLTRLFASFNKAHRIFTYSLVTVNCIAFSWNSCKTEEYLQDHPAKLWLYVEGWAAVSWILCLPWNHGYACGMEYVSNVRAWRSSVNENETLWWILGFLLSVHFIQNAFKGKCQYLLIFCIFKKVVVVVGGIAV